MAVAAGGGAFRVGGLLSGNRVYCLATGAGKTVVAAEIARLAGLKGSRTLFLVHRRELVRQAVDTLYEACPGEQVGVIAAGWPELPWAPLQVGMVQSIAKRERIPDFDLIIVDEAHHARAKTWATVLARWPKARLIGLTATPQRLDGKGLGRALRGDGVGADDTGVGGNGQFGPVPDAAGAVGVGAGRSQKEPGR